MAEQKPPDEESSADPFSRLNIDSHESLENIKGRSYCPKCHGSRKYFCYTCIIPMPEVAQCLRTVSLPIHIDIIKHPKEIDGKSTAVHAAIIAPDDVSLHIYPNIPHFDDKSKVLLVYPADNAVTLKELAEKLTDPKNTTSTEKSNGASIAGCQKLTETDIPPEPKRTRYSDREGLKRFDKVVFIDSTWNQSYSIFRDERLQDLQRVILTSQKTHFWRTQTAKPDTYLATVEAIYYFLLEYNQEILKTDYAGQYDNLLYFFSYMHKLVQISTAEIVGLSKEEKRERHRERNIRTSLEAQIRRQKEEEESAASVSDLVDNQ